MTNYAEKTDMAKKSVHKLLLRICAFIMTAVTVFSLAQLPMASAVNSVNKFSTPYKNSTYYTKLNNAKNKTYADAGKKLAAIAESQVGYKEGLNYKDLDGSPATYKNLSYKAGSKYKNYKGYLDACEYNFWYYGCSDNSSVSKYASSTKTVKGAKYPVSNYNKAWCAVFVSWCAAQAGLSKQIPASAGAGMLGFQKNKKNGTALTNGAKAVAAADRRAGDLVYYYCEKCKATSHIGIVSTNVNYSVEGNANDGVSKINLTKAVSNTCMSGHTTKRFYLRPDIYPKNTSSSTANSFTITYDTNGGIGLFLPKIKIKNVAALISTTKPTRNGYVFKGWKSSSDSVTYQPGDKYTKNASTTLTAVWVKSPITWKTVYVKNITTTSALIGCTVDADCSKLKRIGLQLKEEGGSWKSVASWKVGSVLNYCTVQCGGSKSEISGNLKENTTYQYRFYVETTNVGTLYSTTWSFNTKQTIKTYAINYNANGGSGTFASQTKTTGTAITLPTNKPTKSGYIFKGWKSSSDSVTYQPGASYTKDAATTFIAVWVKSPIAWKTLYVKNIKTTSALVGCTVKADSSKINRIGLQLKEEGGSWKTVASKKVGSVLDAYTVQCGGLNSAINGSLKTNTTYQYRFYVETASDGTLYSSAKSFKTAVKTYTISYNTKGGSGTFDTQKKIKGTALTLPTNIPTKSGYVFRGWKSSSDSVTYQPGAKYTKNAATTFTAVWVKSPIKWTTRFALKLTTNSALIGCTVDADCSKINRIGLQLKEDGGSWKTVSSRKVGSTLNKFIVQCGGADSAINGNLKANTSYQYRFYVETTNVGTLYSSAISFKTEAEAKKFTVSYNTNGGSGTFASQTKGMGDNVTLHKDKPTRNGYVFMGWKSSSDSVTYQPGAQYKMDASTTLTAVWVKNPITFKTMYVKNITATSAFVGCTVDADCSKINRIGLQLKEDGGSWKSVASWKVGSVLDYCTVQCGGANSEISGNLKRNTTYQYRFYVETTNAGTLYTTIRSFTTKA